MVPALQECGHNPRQENIDQWCMHFGHHTKLDSRPCNSPIAEFPGNTRISVVAWPRVELRYTSQFAIAGVRRARISIFTVVGFSNHALPVLANVACGADIP